MKSLILETSTESALLAVVDGARLLGKTVLSGGPQLSKELGLEIKKIIEIAPPPYDRIILGSGPGSYTGIRVGSSMAQALSFGWNTPLFIVSSLTAFAPNEKNFIVVVDARSGGFFVQENWNPPKKISLEEAELLLNSYPVVTSPHPDRIQARLPSLTTLVQTEPNPFLMAQFCTASADPADTCNYLLKENGCLL